MNELIEGKIVFNPQDLDLSAEEIFKVKEAITADRNFVDLVRGKSRIKLNLRNFIYIVS